MGLPLEKLPPPVREYAKARLSAAGVQWPAADEKACEIRFLVQAAMTRDEAMALRLLIESGGSLPGLAKAVGMASPLLATIYRRWQNEGEPYPIRLMKRDEGLEAAEETKEADACAEERRSFFSDRRVLIGTAVFLVTLAVASVGAWLYVGAEDPPKPVEVPTKAVSGDPRTVLENSGALRYGIDAATTLQRLREAGVQEVRCQEKRAGWECVTRQGRDVRPIVVSPSSADGERSASE